MTPEEHLAQAEELLALADAVLLPKLDNPTVGLDVALALDLAQAHADMAAALATHTPLRRPRPDDSGGE